MARPWDRAITSYAVIKFQVYVTRHRRHRKASTGSEVPRFQKSRLKLTKGRISQYIFEHTGVYRLWKFEIDNLLFLIKQLLALLIRLLTEIRVVLYFVTTYVYTSTSSLVRNMYLV